MLVVALVAAAAVVIPPVVWFRVRLRRIEAAIRALRASATHRIEYRPIESTDRPELAAELRAAGMTVLGDAKQVDTGAVSHWFVDELGTTFGMVVFAGAKRYVRMTSLLASRDQRPASSAAEGRRGEIEKHVFTTTMPKLPMLDAGYDAHRQQVAAATSIADMYAKHRVPIANITTLVRVATVDDAICEFLRARDLVIAWREAQNPMHLLELDLRSVLGKHYDAFGPRLLRRMAPSVPAAKAVVRS